MIRYPKIIARITNEPTCLREICLIVLFDAALIFILTALVMACTACSTARKVVCPAARVVKVAETPHAYLVTLEANCRSEIVEVAK